MKSEQLNIYSGKMERRIENLQETLATIRAGRANPAVLNNITVEYYGAPSPISAVAGVSVPEARTILIQPWDGSILGDIEKAILKSDLGINPNNDGKCIRLNFPPLNEERRVELIKQVKKYGEEAKISIRNVRRDANDAFKKAKKDGEITEDDLAAIEKDVDKLTDTYCKKVDDVLIVKEKELTEV